MTDLATARFALPMLASGQAQKEMSHNEALTLIDLLIAGQVEAAGTDVPPEAPEPGQCWILGESPEGAWAGHGGALAGWTGGGWRFVAPREGMRLWLDAEQGFARFSASEWRLGETHGRLIVGGVQVVGPRGEEIAEPMGGTTVDAEARAAIAAVLDALRSHGLIEPG